jgi:hypothetical protein
VDKARWQRLAWMLATRGGTASLFAVALLLQLALAPSFGFALDLETFRQWTHRLDAVGLHDFYDAGPFVDYLPGYLYVAAMLQG